MGRGRPRGSVKPDRRLRRDYRFSPRTLLITEQGRQITGETETAFVEAAIQHYLDFLTASALERQPLRFPGVMTVQVAAQAAQVERPAPSGQVRQHLELVPLVETPSARTSSSRKPTYQIYVKHAHGC